MLNWIRFSTLFLSWRARRAGSYDGRTLIPHRDDVRPPKFLLYLRDIGHWRAAQMHWRWHLRDKVLYPAYVRAHRLCEQARQRLDDAAAQCEEAESLRRTRGTEKNIKALKRWTKLRAKARRRADRAELLLGTTRAKRQAKWEEFRARFDALTAEMDHYMQIYSTANVKARDDNDCPPGLLEENRPRLDMPVGLRALDWELPPRYTHHGQGPTFTA